MFDEDSGNKFTHLGSLLVPLTSLGGSENNKLMVYPLKHHDHLAPKQGALEVGFQFDYKLVSWD